LNATTTGASYVWQDASTNATFLVNSNGTYRVQVSVPGGCQTSDTIVVNYYPAPNLGKDTAICSGQILILDAGPVASSGPCLWQNSTVSSTFKVTQPGTYWVSLCGQTDTIVVKDECDVNLNVPNVFTPNNDGTNDIFKITSDRNLSKIEMIIYDRWGIEVFRSEKEGFGWDGKTSSGIDATEGAYFYVINYSPGNNSTKTLKGQLQLLR
jgi:gliding motility-associated-like protein